MISCHWCAGAGRGLVCEVCDLTFAILFFGNDLLCSARNAGLTWVRIFLSIGRVGVANLAFLLLDLVLLWWAAWQSLGRIPC